jgi:hypothetical protein
MLQMHRWSTIDMLDADCWCNKQTELFHAEKPGKCSSHAYKTRCLCSRATVVWHVHVQCRRTMQ